MVIDQSWLKADTTITGSGDADAVQNWFCCGNGGTFSNWNGYRIGVGCPASRPSLDSSTLTRRLEAEAADSFLDSTPTNQGGQYSTRAWDVGALPNHGWYVGWVTAGEWLKWSQVFFAKGQYDGHQSGFPRAREALIG